MQHINLRDYFSPLKKLEPPCSLRKSILDSVGLVKESVYLPQLKLATVFSVCLCVLSVSTFYTQIDTELDSLGLFNMSPQSYLEVLDPTELSNDVVLAVLLDSEYE